MNPEAADLQSGAKGLPRRSNLRTTWPHERRHA